MTIQHAETRPGKPSIFTNQGKVKSEKSKVHRIERVAIETSRLMEFCTLKELQNQTGHSVHDWPLVILKELVDNALDAAEEAEVAPVITVTIGDSKIIVEDNGPGMPPKIFAGILNYEVRLSSREAYVSPTRGAQGNALKTVLAMDYAVRQERGEGHGRTAIESRGKCHEIIFSVDQIRQQPLIKHEVLNSPVRVGTKITVHWWEQQNLEAVKPRFLRMAENYGWLNPHLTMRVVWDGVECVNITAFDPGWRKWGPRDPTSPHWYDQARFERYMAAFIYVDQKSRRDRTVREFVSEFRGFAGSKPQSLVLQKCGAAYTTLGQLFGTSEHVNRGKIAQLLAALKQHSKPVKPKLIGVIGRAHLLERFTAAGVEPKTFKYKLDAYTPEDGVPRVTEMAFGVLRSGLETRQSAFAERRLIVRGVNWSVGIRNPFIELGRQGESLDATLTELRAGPEQPIIILAHLACPRVQYTDRGKSAIVIT